MADDVAVLTAEVESQTVPASPLEATGPQQSSSHWIRSARFLVVWLFPATLGFYLKWYMMVEQSGFAREARSIGLPALNLYTRISFFRYDVVFGALTIPLALLILDRYLPVRWAAAFTALTSAAAALLIGIQLQSLREFGRFSSLQMLKIGLDWGWHEPGSNIQYLLSAQTLALLLSLVGVGIATSWAVRSSRRIVSASVRHGWKLVAELWLFVVAVMLLLSVRSMVSKSPYYQSSLVRAANSLWKVSAIDSGEFASLDLQHSTGLPTPDMSSLSPAQLVAQYRQLANPPAPQPDIRYFGKERDANVLFFILETTPAKYLNLDGEMSQFPNLRRLEANSFVGGRHYTTFPITRAAVFSLLSSWYPIDGPDGAFDSPTFEKPTSFLRRLSADGYQTAVFSPLRAPGIPDASLFKGVGFQQQFYPSSAISSYDKQPSWQAARVGADVDTLHLLEAHLEQWTSSHDKFVAAFLPQIAHSPYPDGEAGNTAADLQRRGQRILGREDAWLGEIVSLLQKHGQLDNTIIVVVGDHGLRSIEENPDLIRGTIDETAFHVPLLIYAPRALDHEERIPWLTSHIDVVPTLLDLLGIKTDSEFEQGTEIWNPGLANRTTFFFAKPMFGADGYETHGEFYMWHYFSDTVYEKTSAAFYPNDILVRRSPVALGVTSKIMSIVGLEKAWHRKFSEAQPTNESALASTSR